MEGLHVSSCIITEPAFVLFTVSLSPVVNMICMFSIICLSKCSPSSFPSPYVIKIQGTLLWRRSLPGLHSTQVLTSFLLCSLYCFVVVWLYLLELQASSCWHLWNVKEFQR